MRHAVLAVVLILCACADKGAPLEPPLGAGGKHDIADRVDMRGALAFGGEVRGDFTEDLQFQGYTLAVRAGARVKLDVTHAGSSSKLDTTLYVYGPASAAGAYGTDAIAYDDDSGWGLLSRLRDLELAEAGSYLVVLGTFDGRGRGHYRVTAACESGECAPEVVEGPCVFGESYHEARNGTNLQVLEEKVVTSAADLDALERDQVVLAAHASTHDDVTTAEQAMDAFDQGEVNIVELWDTTARLSFTVYEYGAGDNSYGRIFVRGTTETAALIGDGEIRECVAPQGPEGRDCAVDGDCAAGLACVGIAEGHGLCRDTAADDHPDEGSPCSATAHCVAGSGLLCAGLTREPAGLCLPAWMRRRYAATPGVDITDSDPAGVTSSVLVSGLATVDMDVSVSLRVVHPDTTQLRVTLTNPAGTEAVVFDGEPGQEIWVDDLPVDGFPGDESVNGTWTLRVVDKTTGETGLLDAWDLLVGSRP
ncbi:MAG TPA: proprotein convertase P-domain-containing protein [Kofleriaceae bacterium]|nr:proprotein convertase P-domain-containing protein [Kofleriaceae bacterium]